MMATSAWAWPACSNTTTSSAGKRQRRKSLDFLIANYLVRPVSERQKTEDIQLRLRAEVEFAIGDDGDREWDGQAGGVAKRLQGAVIEFAGEVAGIVGAENGGVRLRGGAVVDGPDDGVGSSERGDRGGGAQSAVGFCGLRSGGGAEKV